MAWEEQRRLRSARGGDTAEITGLPAAAAPAPASADDRPATSAGRGAEVERWGQRFGWMVAGAIAVVALTVALLAFANSGPAMTSIVGRGPGAFAPYGRPARGFGGPYGTGLGPGFVVPR